MNYKLTVAGLTRSLPIIKINATTAIASFVLLGDDELSAAAARAILPQLPHQFDFIVTVESKGIPFAHDLALYSGHTPSIVIRKSVKAYMDSPVITNVNSITTQHSQKLVLDGTIATQLRGKQVVIADDVISTGNSLRAVEDLMTQMGAKVVDRVAILAEGAAAQRTDIHFLSPLPLFNPDGTEKQ